MISTRGSVKRGERSMLMITVLDFETQAGVPRARVRAQLAPACAPGACVRTCAGNVQLVLRARRRGALVLTASKRGYTPASARATVR